MHDSMVDPAEMAGTRESGASGGGPADTAGRWVRSDMLVGLASEVGGDSSVLGLRDEVAPADGAAASNPRRGGGERTGGDHIISGLEHRWDWLGP